MKNTLPLSFAFAALLLPGSALADGHSQIVLAEQHAGLAAQSTDVALVHTHLHHTLNCLVGPGGPGFDAHEMNPCANAGHGAIPDGGLLKKLSLQAAAAEARKGIAEPDLAKAQQHAAATAEMLNKAE
ncbi:MAG: hypothetical protein ABSD21_07505 [Rhizomicrobium sp.]|jgi:hypothetical protein